MLGVAGFLPPSSASSEVMLSTIVMTGMGPRGLIWSAYNSPSDSPYLIDASNEQVALRRYAQVPEQASSVAIAISYLIVSSWP